MITVTDGFCGAGGSSTGLVAAGMLVKTAVNHWDLAIKTHAVNHPNTEHELTDLMIAHPSLFPYTDVLWMSPECFPSGTLILTTDGLIPIEDVKVGDLVCTHKGRWKPVTATMSTIKDTIVLSGHGNSRLETTSEHPFYVKQQTNKRVDTGRFRHYTHANGRMYTAEIKSTKRQLSDSMWVKAADLTQGTYRWATPIHIDKLSIPHIGGRGFDYSCDFWWMVGRWLGDGTVRIRKHNAELTICCGKHEVEDLSSKLARIAQPEELKRAQSFPSDYVVLGNKREQVRQVGNAVACNVAQWIAERCIESMKVS